MVNGGERSSKPDVGACCCTGSIDGDCSTAEGERDGQYLCEACHGNWGAVEFTRG